MTIIITGRGGDYHACIEGQEGRWASGASIDEAVGNLVRYHAECFGITVTIAESARKRLHREQREAIERWKSAP